MLATAPVQEIKVCEHVLIQTPEDASVCTKCGLVVDGGLCDYARVLDRNDTTSHRVGLCLQLAVERKLYGTYQRIFHFNERMAQLCLCEPSIPSDLWELIETEFDYGEFEREYPKPATELTKEHIKQICASIRVPNRLQEKYRSQKFKQNLLKDMKRFTEKWLTIRRKLGAEAPPQLGPNVVERLQRWFMALEKPFNIYRHSANCQGGPKCHKSASKCRHNFPNYNYLILQLLKKEGLADTYAKYLPQLRTGAKIRNLDTLCEKIWNYLEWDFTPVFQRKKRKRKLRKSIKSNKRKRV